MGSTQNCYEQQRNEDECKEVSVWRVIVPTALYGHGVLEGK